MSRGKKTRPNAKCLEMRLRPHQWLILVLVFASCSGSSTANLIVALGDSVFFEATAHVPCTSPLMMPSYACPDGDGFLPIVARSLPQPTAFQNLSSPGAHTVTIPLYEVPMMSPAATVVVLFIGSTDRQPVAYQSNYTLEQWEEDYDWGIAAIHARAPRARLIIATLPNPAYVPFFVRGMPNNRLTLKDQRLVGATTLAMDTFIAGHKEDVLDLRCDRDFYTESTLNPDKFHPNEIGYRGVAERVIAILKSPRHVRAKSACPPFTNLP